MAGFSSRHMILSTSPRSPYRIKHYLSLLEPFEGSTWNNQTQTEYYQSMVDHQEGDFSIGASHDPAFSARDKINRAPKALGFVKLKPLLEFTEAGRAFMSPYLSAEILTRQILKYQFPSPYFPEQTDNEGYFNIKPFLELIRLIDKMEELSINEFRRFGITMTNYEDFDEVVNNINQYRLDRSNSELPSNKFYAENIEKFMCELYSDKIESDAVGVRESTTRSAQNFIRIKVGNLKDNADAYIRYLLGTELVRVNSRKRLVISEDRTEDVRYILENIGREASEYSESEFIEYMGNPTEPHLLTDDADVLYQKIEVLDDQLSSYEDLLEDIDVPTFPSTGITILDLKITFYQKEELLKQAALETYSLRLDTFNEDEVQNILETFDGIRSKVFFDNPLYLEWNTWRALTMIIDGNIKGNFKVNTLGEPISTAGGNLPDIISSYPDYNVLCEVTLSGGKRQYEMENEPVMRHLGEIRQATGNETFGLFIAPKINDSLIAEFYYKHKISTRIYGGTVEFIPLDIIEFKELFLKIVQRSHKISKDELITIHQKTKEIAGSASDEVDWLSSIKNFIFTL